MRAPVIRPWLALEVTILLVLLSSASTYVELLALARRLRKVDTNGLRTETIRSASVSPSALLDNELRNLEKHAIQCHRCCSGDSAAVHLCATYFDSPKPHDFQTLLLCSRGLEAYPLPFACVSPSCVALFYSPATTLRLSTTARQETTWAGQLNEEPRRRQRSDGVLKDRTRDAEISHASGRQPTDCLNASLEKEGQVAIEVQRR